ncbi:hypothetical protein SCOR_06255 [Sulfidibacter corallicola]
MRFASISYPLETRWPVCRTTGNPAPGLGGDSVVKKIFDFESMPDRARTLHPLT